MSKSGNRRIIQSIPFFFFFYNLLKKIFYTPSFIRDFFVFYFKNRKQGRFAIPLSELYPCLTDKTKITPFDSHYIYHPAWAARIIARLNPKKHIDIASSLSFSSLLSAFIEVEFYDMRPALLHLSNFSSKHANLLDLPFKTDSIESLSCMHTIEHVGLGRYGDAVDPEGDIKACNELARVLQKGGHLLFVVPLGRSRIEFNAHRIYSLEQVKNLFPHLDLIEYSVVLDDWRQGLIKSPDSKTISEQEYACGCFLFKK